MSNLARREQIEQEIQTIIGQLSKYDRLIRTAGNPVDRDRYKLQQGDLEERLQELEQERDKHTSQGGAATNSKDNPQPNSATTNYNPTSYSNSSYSNSQVIQGGQQGQVVYNNNSANVAPLAPPVYSQSENPAKPTLSPIYNRPHNPVQVQPQPERARLLEDVLAANYRLKDELQKRLFFAKDSAEYFELLNVLQDLQVDVEEGEAQIETLSTAPLFQIRLQQIQSLLQELHAANESFQANLQSAVGAERSELESQFERRHQLTGELEVELEHYRT